MGRFVQMPLFDGILRIYRDLIVIIFHKFKDDSIN